MTSADRLCAWCAAPVSIVRRPGRPRLYCNQSCRQRAYEHRHGFTHRRTMRPLPGQARGDRWSGTGYELGRTAVPWGRTHAMRPAVRPEGTRRETVCGLLAYPVPGRHFMSLGDKDCLTCSELVARHPLPIGISASNELSRLRAVIVEGAERRLDPDTMLTWLVHQVPDAAIAA